MGCCCLSHESAEIEEPLRIRANPGPPPRRRCTDFPCCILFVAVLVGNGTLLVLFGQVGDLRRIDHGRDHDGNLCGLGTEAARAYAFYPDLETDFAKDPSLQQRYGICLPGCPAVGSTVEDYGNMRQAEWVVLQPSFAVFGRCVPYQRPADQSSTKLCASPACEPIAGAPTKPQQVCGLKRDGTDKYWLLEHPDTSIEDGWRAEGADSAVISARATMAGTSKGSDCRQQLRREADVSIRPLDDSMAYNLLTSVTSPVYSVGNSISSNYALILGLGVVGSAVMSVIIMLLFPICAPPVLLSLLVVVFVALILTDYVLFVQGGIASGRTGAQLQRFLSSLSITVPSGAESLLTQASSNQATMQWFAVSGCLLAVAIMLLACTVLSLAKQFRVVLALLSEAGNMIRRVPSLLALPMILLLSLALFAILLMLGLLGVATASQEQVASLIGGLNMQGDEAVRRFQQGAAGVLIVSFIWLYFFHVAIYHNTIALTVSRWYFRGDLQEHHMCPSLGGCLGGPVAISLLQAFRYHVGSLAFGALALTACTVPRLVLEYVEKHAKETGEQNALAAAVRCATRCCLSWLHCCLQFVTEYAYMYVAIIGEPFCPSTCKSFQLFTKYPAQVALNTLTSVVLGFLVCIGVPFALVLAAFFELRDSWVNFQPVAVCVIILAYIISRMSVGVYDAILTTLFICAMRDEEYCGGQHMGPELRQALQLRGGSREVEFS